MARCGWWKVQAERLGFWGPDRGCAEAPRRGNTSNVKGVGAVRRLILATGACREMTHNLIGAPKAN